MDEVAHIDRFNAGGTGTLTLDHADGHVVGMLIEFP
jgi:hypothetical protein